MNANDVIARLRELRDEYWKAAGPFRLPPNVPAAGLNVFQVERYFAETASVALPALLECASALEQLLDDLGQLAPAEPSIQAVEEARAALQALAEGGGE